MKCIKGEGHPMIGYTYADMQRASQEKNVMKVCIP